MSPMLEVQVDDSELDGTAPPRGASGLIARVPLLADLSKRTSFWIFLVLVALCLIFEFGAPHNAFFSETDVTAMLLASAEGILLALGMAFMLGAGELDLSVGANLILSSVLASKTLLLVSGSASQAANGVYPHLALGLVAAVIVGVAAAVLFGICNAFAVTVMRVNSLIATLATAGIGTGVALVVTNAVDVPNLPVSLQTSFAGQKLAGVVPMPVLIPAVVAPILWWVLNRSQFGVHTLALGSSRVAAERAGINVRRHMFKLYILMGILAAIAGFIDVTQFDTTSVSSHTTDALAAISACVIGGTSLFGGSAFIGGTVIGAFLPVILGSGLVIVGVTAYWQDIVVGAILLIAVFIDQRRRSAR